MPYWMPKKSLLEKQYQKEQKKKTWAEQMPWWAPRTAGEALSGIVAPFTALGEWGKTAASTLLSPFYKSESGRPAVETWTPERVLPEGGLRKPYEEWDAPPLVKGGTELVAELPFWLLGGSATAQAMRQALKIPEEVAASQLERALAAGGRGLLKPVEILEKAPGAIIKKLKGKPSSIRNIPKELVEGGVKIPEVTPKPAVSPTGEIAPVTEGNIPAELISSDEALNKFGKDIASAKTTRSYEAQQKLWSEERGIRSAKFNEILEQEIASGTDAKEAIKKATAAFKGAYPRDLTDMALPPEVEKVAYEKIISVINADDTIPAALKSFEITSTKTALDNALRGQPIPGIPGMKGGSAKSRLLRIFKDNKVIKNIIENPDDWQTTLLESKADPLGVDMDMAAYLRGLKDTPSGKDAPFVKQFANMSPTARDKVIKNLKKLGLNLVDALGIPKALKFAFDMSMMFRQLGPSGARHPVSWVKTWKPYFQAMKSEKAAIALDNMIRTEPDRMKAIFKLGLDPYDMGKGATYWNRPESMASQIAEKYIPGVRMSNRGAAVAVNYFITDIGKGIVKVLEKAGATDDEFKAMGSLINEIVGRGEMPKFLHGTAGDILNKLLASPRYLASRFEWPTKLASKYPSVRKEAWGSLAAWVGVNASILTLAKASGVATVEGDPRSSDVVKLRIGNKRFDLWAGASQIVRLAAQLAPYYDNGEVDWTKGSRKNADGKLVKVDRGQLLARFAQSKESPGIGALVSLLTGKNFLGEPIDFSTLGGWGKYIKETLTPAALEEMADAYFIDGLPSAVISSLGLAGVGVSTYEKKETPKSGYTGPRPGSSSGKGGYTGPRP